MISGFSFYLPDSQVRTEQTVTVQGVHIDNSAEAGTDLELPQGHLKEVEDGVWQCWKLGNVWIVTGHITKQEKETYTKRKDFQ